MSKLRFRGEVYNLETLLKLRNISPMYKEGEVEDLDTGEFLDIGELDKLKSNYVLELLPRRELSRAFNIVETKSAIEELESKFKKNTISKSEMFILLEYHKEGNIIPNYDYGKGYLILNLNKYPKGISDGDYGKFNKLLFLLSSNHKNQLAYSNGKAIKKQTMSKFLGYKDVEYLNKFFRRLKKLRMVDDIKLGGIKYLMINPAYARKNMKIDSTIYKAFKKDLDTCLTPLQIYYLNLPDDNVDLNNLIAIE